MLFCHFSCDFWMENMKSLAVHLLKTFVFIDEGRSGSWGFSADSVSTIIGIVGNHLGWQ